MLQTTFEMSSSLVTGYTQSSINPVVFFVRSFLSIFWSHQMRNQFYSAGLRAILSIEGLGIFGASESRSAAMHHRWPER